MIVNSMRCQKGVTGAGGALGTIEAFGTPQAPAIGRRPAVTQADGR